MRTLLSGSVKFGFIGIVLAACSASVPDKYASTDEYCAARANAECTQIASLCAVTMDACTSARQGVCATDVANALSAGRKYNSASVQGCVDQTNTVYAQRVIAPADQAALNDTCERIFEGSAVANAKCTSEYDCSGSLVCDPTFNVCAVSTATALDAPCSNPGDVCADDSYCAAQPSMPALRVCQPDATMGEPCGDLTPCTDTLQCANTCVPRYLAGQGCTTDANCDPSAPYCDPEAPVSPFPGSCDAGIIFSPTQPVCTQYGKT
jgi:hypothetical protein